MSAVLAKVVYNINPYAYQVTEWVCALFVALFGLSTLIHFGQALASKRWYLIPSLVLGGIGEIIGWSGRLWSSKNLTNPTPFLMQISATIISPTFLAAANFIILGTIINRAGPAYSRLPSSWYGLIFITIDVIALIVQAIGGGIASAATQEVGGNPDFGGHIMLAGIVIQLAEIVVYAILAADFFANLVRKKIVRPSAPGPRAGASPITSESKTTVVEEERQRQSGSEDGSAIPSNVEKGVDVPTSEFGTKEALMSWALAFSTLCLFIRAVYRTAELSDGWGGRIIHTQVYFNVLDGAMIVLSMYTLNFFHPLWLL